MAHWTDNETEAAAVRAIYRALPPRTWDVFIRTATSSNVYGELDIADAHRLIAAIHGVAGEIDAALADVAPQIAVEEQPPIVNAEAGPRETDPQLLSELSDLSDRYGLMGVLLTVVRMMDGGRA